MSGPIFPWGDPEFVATVDAWTPREPPGSPGLVTFGVDRSAHPSFAEAMAELVAEFSAFLDQHGLAPQDVTMAVEETEDGRHVLRITETAASLERRRAAFEALVPCRCCGAEPGGPHTSGLCR